MKSFLQVLFGFILGLSICYVAKHDWRGQTIEKRLDGVVSVNTNRRITGIDPKTKLEYDIFFGPSNPKSMKVYHDAISKDKQYVTWKEDKLCYWDINVHIYP
jgi:hypothetical protein